MTKPNKKDHATKKTSYSKGFDESIAALKDELLKNPGIKSVTSGSSYPGIANVEDMLFYAEGKTVHDVIDVRLTSIENDYFETLGIKLLAGRSFSKDFRFGLKSNVNVKIRDKSFN